MQNEISVANQIIEINLPQGFRVITYSQIKEEQYKLPWIYAYNFANQKWYGVSIFDLQEESCKFLLLIVPK
jgi:hypothetical protein